MKNQYFGDENDFRKYGLIRALTNRGAIRCGVCWMLTSADGSRDGSFTSYLEQSTQWRRYDPELYDALLRCVRHDERHVRHADCPEILPASLFYSEILSDEVDDRRCYFQEMLERFRGVPLVFFDPDNGLEVKTKPRGRRGSSKFLFWDEVETAYSAEHSLLIYQHFRREERSGFAERMATELARRTGAPEIHTFATPRVLFLLAPRPEHCAFFGERAKAVGRQWGTQVIPTHYRSDRGTLLVHPVP